MNQTQTHHGVGRKEKTVLDHFILTRKVNHPELLFNQSPHRDGYFEDQVLEWELSNECFVCEKHRYTLIFYQKNDPNEGIKEITKTSEVQAIKESLRLGFADQHDTSPIITGSVINNSAPFSRKLKMMRADLFTLMCISESPHFTKPSQSGGIKRGTL